MRSDKLRRVSCRSHIFLERFYPRHDVINIFDPHIRLNRPDERRAVARRNLAVSNGFHDGSYYGGGVGRPIERRQFKLDRAVFRKDIGARGSCTWPVRRLLPVQSSPAQSRAPLLRAGERGSCVVLFLAPAGGPDCPERMGDHEFDWVTHPRRDSLIAGPFLAPSV